MVHIGATTAIEAPDGSIRLERRVVYIYRYIDI